MIVNKITTCRQGGFGTDGNFLPRHKNERKFATNPKYTSKKNSLKKKHFRKTRWKNICTNLKTILASKKCL